MRSCFNCLSGQSLLSTAFLLKPGQSVARVASVTGLPAGSIAMNGKTVPLSGSKGISARSNILAFPVSAATIARLTRDPVVTDGTTHYRVTGARQRMQSAGGPPRWASPCRLTGSGQLKGHAMSVENHTKAAEAHDSAAKSHRSAAEHIGKGDGKAGSEHSATAHSQSEAAHKQSTAANSNHAGNKPSGAR
jgi:hypothetical protein